MHGKKIAERAIRKLAADGFQLSPGGVAVRPDSSGKTIWVRQAAIALPLAELG